MNGAQPPRWLAAGLLSIAALSIAATVAMPGTFRALAPLTPDSQTYLAWNPGRTPAYPAFLAALRFISPDLQLLGPVQLIVFLAVASWCAFSFAHVYGQPLLALLFGAAVMLHPQLVSYAFVALPESLFAAVLCLHFGAVLRASKLDRWRPYLAVGFSLALLILLKPSGYGVAAGVFSVLF